jgi:uncharacterized protein YfiM (DUF2279 family)
MNELMQACMLASAVSCAAPPPCGAGEAVQHADRTHAPCRVGSHGGALFVRDDAWLGADKFTHAAASWAAVAFAFGATRSAGVPRDDALLVATSAALTAGIAKELIDRRRYGLFSVRDLVADALGVGVAYFFLREVR